MAGKTALASRAELRKDARGETLRVICDADILDCARTSGQPPRQVYLQSMNMGIIPLRYLRNRPSITLAQQILLLESCVAVVGAGGLGGHVIQGLARLGVGVLHLFDPDVFDETNLNRQVFASQDTLGRSKVQVAQECCRRINPGVDVVIHPVAVTDLAQTGLFSGVRIIVDALDSPKDRLTLAAIARQCRLPLVHGAVAGFEGRATTVWPSDTTMETLYSGEAETLSAEHRLGTPYISPALIASFQIMAVLNLLLNRTQAQGGRILHLDMNRPSLDLFSI